MKIDLSKLNYTFSEKPLLIGGKAMEYYGLRKAGADIDLVVSGYDHENLKTLYPNDVKDLYGDIGVCECEFEIWNQICLFRYDFLKQNAIEKKTHLVAGIDKLIFLKAIAMQNEKYMKDLKLLVKYATDIQYGKEKLP